MQGDPLIVRSRRLRLVLQALAVVAVAGVVGALAESSPAIQGSLAGELGTSIGLPLSFLVFLGIGLVIAVVALKDSWNHRITLSSDSLEIRDALGRYRVGLSEIDSVKPIPLGGIGIAFKDPERWLGRFSHSQSKRRRVANVVRRAYQCDVLVARKNMDISEEQLVNQIQRRIDPT